MFIINKRNSHEPRQNPCETLIFLFFLFLLKYCVIAKFYGQKYRILWTSQRMCSSCMSHCQLSQTLLGNQKEPVELGNPNSCVEVKLCLLRNYPAQEIVYRETKVLNTVRSG